MSGVCQAKCRDGEICAFDSTVQGWRCRELDPIEDCPTEPGCSCDTELDCPRCHDCIDSQCVDQCSSSEICCIEDNIPGCVTGTCCNSADCGDDEICYEYNCVTNPFLDTTCGDVTRTDIDNYFEMCFGSGLCEYGHQHAFDSIDLSGYLPDDVVYNGRSSYWYSQNVIYCCQTGKTCDDGELGCCPDVEPCCDVNDCTDLISYTYGRFDACTFNDNYCVGINIPVPRLFVNESPANTYNYLQLDYDTIDWTQPQTCSALRAARTEAYSESNATRCQTESGKVDTDFPCSIQLLITSPSTNCPTNCTNE